MEGIITKTIFPLTVLSLTITASIKENVESVRTEVILNSNLFQINLDFVFMSLSISLIVNILQKILHST